MTNTYIPVCPACDKPMVTLEWRGIEVDYCIGCHGVWLDHGELQSILGEGRKVESGWLPKEKSQLPPKKTKRLCPRCDARLVEFQVEAGDKGELKLDRCPHGHGLWFDGGELETYLRQVATDESSVARVGSFLKELFGGK